ncbi:UbiX family flavin prenyltransferase [Campylobacter helveticus]|uniref:UbiX family flavin prenyltransferase n=1 Tax=Campylobacter helveticus TaxID=28898 RepID=A0AAX2UJY2_9BACT|nr:UbiX family flavin prenyltransferase [Campylobacter helveticus]ARE80046.1 3-octaprenyl-4-hydroxybenzoate carboxy-lyase [Campylobacter helveticus]MCR2039623.1 UbiX family flavin prenyltransferase [Campylobacter helveticus]MCR2054457.1 UbiX family flavin prenyltransferase [Campylobacter helveticus]MCR2060537.1 UbiX family flavin prenyltransferase [Campylobacter helveticus]MCR2061392.1 UbiX family flavin prenyltransferase [Campylobacter helveticus]
MKILLGISGSSSVHLGLKILEILEQESELFCIITKGAKKSFVAENKQNLEQICKKFHKCTFLDDEDLSAGVSSGSFGIEKTLIAPSSISTLAKIHAGFCDTLLTRACAVALKERRKLILAVREMPFSTLNLEHMAKLSSMGVVIAPPIYASYGGVKNLEDFENFIVGKWLDLLEIRHNLYKRWS